MRRDEGLLCGKRALISDLSSTSCELLSAILTDSGMQVKSVCCWNCVLEAARSFAPDVMLLDVSGFNATSHEMLSSLREMPDLRATPLIALTPTSMFPEPHAMAQAGFAALLAKPIRPGSLRTTIRELLGPQHEGNL